MIMMISDPTCQMDYCLYNIWSANNYTLKLSVVDK